MTPYGLTSAGSPRPLPEAAGAVRPDELAAVDLLRVLPPDALEALAAGASTRRYAAGEVVFAEGDEGHELHVVRSGLLHVMRPSAHPEMVLHTLEPGDCFGELAVLNDGRRLASVIALRDSETVHIGRDVLDAVLEANPGAVRRMLGEVARSLTLAKEELARHNRELEQRVRERTEELRQTHLEVIRRLAQAAEWRDDTTGLHITRMSRMVYRLARRAGLDDDAAEMLMHASTMHDIGYRHDQLVAGGHRLGDDLPRRGDDRRLCASDSTPSSVPPLATPTTHVPFW